MSKGNWDWNLIRSAERHENEAGYARDKFLVKLGWRHTSDHPDSCWRWTKEIEGKTYALSRSDAISFEESLAMFAGVHRDDDEEEGV